MYFVYFGFDVFTFMGCICQGGTLCFVFSVFIVSFTYGKLVIDLYYEVIQGICFFFFFVKSSSLICFTCIFHTCIYVFVECFKNL